MVPTTLLVNSVLTLGLLYRWLSRGHIEWWLLLPFLIIVATLAWRAYRLKARVAELIIAAAVRCDLTRVSGDRAKPKAAS